MNKKVKGIFYILTSALFFALMNSFIKASGDLHFSQKALFRNLIALIVSFVIYYRNNTKYRLTKHDAKLIFGRAIFGTVGLLCNFYAVDRMILADANMLNKLSPFFAILFSYFLLKEKPGKLEIMAVIVAFIGGILIIKPGFGFNNIASVVGLAGGMFAGAAYTIVRMLGKDNVPGTLIVFGFSLISVLAILPMALMNYSRMTVYQLTMLILAGIMATIAQFAITAAYRNAPAKELSVFDYFQIIFAAIIGFFVFNQLPDTLSIVGYLLVIAMAFIMFLNENGYIKKH